MLRDAGKWAAAEFGHAELGDQRRTARLVQLAGRLAKKRGGKVTEVVTKAAEREGTFRFLENKAIAQASLTQAAGSACAKRGAEYPFMHVPIDKTSAQLADAHGKKQFGPVGTNGAGARGIHAISAVGISPKGEVLGLLAQQFWMRPARRTTTRRARPKCKRTPSQARAQARQKLRRRRAQPVEEKQTQQWLDTLQSALRRCDEQATPSRCWFQLDREGDAWPILKALTQAASGPAGPWWTVRASWNRRVLQAGGTKSYLRSVLASQPVLGGYRLHVAAGPKRTEREADVLLRSAEVVLDLKDQRTGRHEPLRVGVVWAQEVDTCPPGDKPLDWLLLTNHPIATREQAWQVVEGYSHRWQIEEVHKTWKSGGCRVEETQLHTQAAVEKWATLLFVVATRIERLKRLARTSPELPASVELSAHEIRALLLLKRREKKRTETISDTMPTIGQAARWIADLGGYIGKSSGGPFGSITLGRGFERVVIGAETLASLEAETGSD
jgi:Transposase DNA-binding/Transposase Tn5 dimerisation domain